MKAPATLLTSACLCAPALGSAAEWSAAPVIAWSVDHDSNRRLSEDAQAGEGALLQLDVLLKRTTGASVLALRPRAGWQRYTHDAAQRTNNQSLHASGTWLEKDSVLTAEAAVARDNSLNNELQDTGLFTGGTLRMSRNASLSWRHQYSPRSQLELQAAHSDVEYENERTYSWFGTQIPLTSLYGYQYPSVVVTQTYQWSARSAAQFSAYAARLITDNEAGDSDSYGARLGLSRALTSRTALFFSAGLSRQSVAGGSESGYIGRFELTRSHELSRWRLHAERSVSASGYGYLVRRTDAGLTFDQRLAPRWNATFALRSLRNADVTAAASGERKSFERAEASLGWQATRTWRVTTSASFTRAQQTEDTRQVEGWRTLVSAVWSPRPGTMSR